jgi:hypothetical protein
MERDWELIVDSGPVILVRRDRFYPLHLISVEGGTAGKFGKGAHVGVRQASHPGINL